MKKSYIATRALLLAFAFLFCLSSVCVAADAGSEDVDPNVYVEVYDPERVWDGTTLLADNHIPGEPRIIEVNMEGEIVWEYVLPEDLPPASDVELLPNGNILFVTDKGLYEIDRDGNIVWSYLDEKVSHDADRLPNGNTLVVFGGDDQIDDAHVKEISPEGEVVWAWYAKDHFYKEPYKDIYEAGWTHTNAVTRLPNGNTMISLRNFLLTVEVNPEGEVVWSYDWSSLGIEPHEPELLPNGNLLIALHGGGKKERAVEVNPKTGEVVWEFNIPGLIGLRDADRLPNGNTLLCGGAFLDEGPKVLEVTPDKKIVWQLGVKGVKGTPEDHQKWFYKAERISAVAPQISIVSPENETYPPGEIEISIDYVDVDLGAIWYRVYDRSNDKWVTDEVTYLRNVWSDGLTFEGTEEGPRTVTLDEGEYTLYVRAESTGWGNENLLERKVINTTEASVDFTVEAKPSEVTPTPTPTPTVTATTTTPSKPEKPEVTVAKGKIQASIPKIEAGKAEIIMVEKADIPLRYMRISVRNSVNDVQITVNRLEEKPPSVTVDVEGKVYQYFEISHQNIASSDVSKVLLEFTVEKSWIKANNIDRHTVSLQRYGENGWSKLPTYEVDEDPENVYYKAESPGLSIYAISGITVTPTPTETETPTPTPTKTVAPSPTASPSPTSSPSPTATPSPTPTETTTEKKGESRCIIATSTFGSELAPEVQFLRGFRENVALKTFAGSQFMRVFNAWYYSFSPPVAAVIASNEPLKAVMRPVLLPLLKILQLAVTVNSALSFNPELAIVLTGLVASSLIGIVYFTPVTLASLYLAKRRWKYLPKPGKLTVLLTPWLVSLALICLGEATLSATLMMAATGAFIIFTIALTAGAISLKILQHH